MEGPRKTPWRRSSCWKPSPQKSRAAEGGSRWTLLTIEAVWGLELPGGPGWAEVWGPIFCLVAQRLEGVRDDRGCPGCGGKEQRAHGREGPLELRGPCCALYN